MNVLITGAESRLGQAIARELAPGNQLRLWGAGDPPSEPGEKITYFEGDMRDPDVAWRAVRNIQAIIHTGEPPPNLPEDDLACEQELLDLATRGTHVLFKAGVDAGIKRFVYGSTLQIFEAYPNDVYISEMWRPMPSTDKFQLTRYLGEMTAREFARDFPIAVTVLRLGKLIAEEDVSAQDPDLMWVDYRDAARAFRLSLNRDAQSELKWNRRFALHHICADISNPKYLVGQISGFQLRGFQPQHNFEALWRGGGA